MKRIRIRIENGSLHVLVLMKKKNLHGEQEQYINGAECLDGGPTVMNAEQILR